MPADLRKHVIRILKYEQFMALLTQRYAASELEHAVETTQKGEN